MSSGETCRCPFCPPLTKFADSSASTRESTRAATVPRKFSKIEARISLSMALAFFPECFSII